VSFFYFGATKKKKKKTKKKNLPSHRAALVANFGLAVATMSDRPTFSINLE